MTRYTIDRFEGDVAVLLVREDESQQIDLPREQLPKGAKEGDILEVELSADNKVVNAKVLNKETNTARKKAENLLQKLLDKNKT